MQDTILDFTIHNGGVVVTYERCCGVTDCCIIVDDETTVYLALRLELTQIGFIMYYDPITPITKPILQLQLSFLDVTYHDVHKAVEIASQPCSE